MSSYQKFSLSTFRGKLKDKAYDTLAGANRAIGKMRELSDAEREKARRMAASHFGAEAPPKAAKAAKKEKKVAKTVAKIVKKAAKRAARIMESSAAPAKKVSKKVAKKRAAKQVAAAPKKRRAKRTPIMERALAVVKDAPASRVFKAPTEEQIAARRSGIIEQMGSVISTVGQALKAMEETKKLFPKADLEAGVSAASETLSRAVRVIDRDVLTPQLSSGQEEMRKVTSKLLGKEKLTKKSTPKAGKRSKAVEPPDEEPEEVEKPGNGAIDDSNLDEEELAALDDAVATSKKVMNLKRPPKASSLAT